MSARPQKTSAQGVIPSFTHKQLCEYALKWAARPKSKGGPGCLFSLSETKSGYTGEAPDVIGWRVAYGPSGGFDSVLIECKTSLSDFYADLKKPFRAYPAKGMGVYRYYFAPLGLISTDLLPAKWGLIEVNARGQLVVSAGHALAIYRDEHLWRFETNQNAEHSLLCSALCRVNDPQKVQAQIREKNNQIARLAAAAERERAAHEKTKSELYALRFGRTA